MRVFNLGKTLPVPVTELVNILERILKVKAKKNIMQLPRNSDNSHMQVLAWLIGNLVISHHRSPNGAEEFCEVVLKVLC